MNNENSLLHESIKKGFLIWSWLGLLGAYVSTSSIFSNQLYIVLTQGARGLDLGQFAYTAFGFLFLPPLVLVMGWLAFYKYSTYIIKIAIFPSEIEDATDSEYSKGLVDPWRLMLLFKSSVLYLILSWIVMLFSVFFPYLMSFWVGMY